MGKTGSHIPRTLRWLEARGFLCAKSEVWVPFELRGWAYGLPPDDGYLIAAAPALAEACELSLRNAESLIYMKAAWKETMPKTKKVRPKARAEEGT